MRTYTNDFTVKIKVRVVNEAGTSNAARLRAKRAMKRLLKGGESPTGPIHLIMIDGKLMGVEVVSIGDVTEYHQVVT